MTEITILIVHIGLASYGLAVGSPEDCSAALLKVSDARSELSEMGDGGEVWSQCMPTGQYTLTRSLRPRARPERA